jgi:hypothetical protein
LALPYFVTMLSLPFLGPLGSLKSEAVESPAPGPGGVEQPANTAVLASTVAAKAAVMVCLVRCRMVSLLVSPVDDVEVMTEVWDRSQ